MTEPATVLVCGSLHLDIVVDAPSLPSIDETINGTSVNYAFGGKGGNQAVAASLHGAKTRFAGCIGEDEFGKTLHAHLIRHNINCENLQKTNGASGMSVAIVDDNGDYGAVIVSSANLNINSDAIHLPSSAKFLLLQNEIPEQVNEQLAKKAQEKDIPVMLNAAPFRTLPEKMVPLIDTLVLNRVEASQFFNQTLTNDTDIRSVLNTATHSINTIIITLGKDGLFFRDGSGSVHQKSAFPVTTVSSHGAGDMFCGALATRRAAGDTMDDALGYAMAAAACHVSTPVADRSSIGPATVYALLAH